MKKILICPDKFKGSLTAPKVCDAIRQGLLEAVPGTVADSVPLADGGEGTCDLLTEWNGGTRIEIEVRGPMWKPVIAQYGLSADGGTAFIEMAEASGLMLLTPEERNPLLTSSIGTGEMIVDALNRNVERIILGIGGSATNDAGIGMASALGYEFCDAEGIPLQPIGENLIHIHHIRAEGVHPRLSAVSFVTLCDVDNPLFGEEGAAHIYAPQKGADRTAVELLDAGLRNFRRVVRKYLQKSVDFRGAGAAGGMGAGTRVFLNASIERGIDYVMNRTGLINKMRESDLIITGEGKIDTQTLSGKVVAEVMRNAKKAKKPVLAICGISELSQAQLRALGFIGLISLVDENTSSETAIKQASALIRKKVAEDIGKYIDP